MDNYNEFILDLVLFFHFFIWRTLLNLVLHIDRVHLRIDVEILNDWGRSAAIYQAVY